MSSLQFSLDFPQQLSPRMSHHVWIQFVYNIYWWLETSYVIIHLEGRREVILIKDRVGSEDDILEGAGVAVPGEGQEVRKTDYSHSLRKVSRQWLLSSRWSAALESIPWFSQEGVEHLNFFLGPTWGRAGGPNKQVTLIGGFPVALATIRLKAMSSQFMCWSTQSLGQQGFMRRFIPCRPLPPSPPDWPDNPLFLARRCSVQPVPVRVVECHPCQHQGEGVRPLGVILVPAGEAVSSFSKMDGGGREFLRKIGGIYGSESDSVYFLF